MTEAVIQETVTNTGCPHLHTVVDTIGSRFFIARDVYDDTQERLVCIDCGEDLTPQDETELPY